MQISLEIAREILPKYLKDKNNLTHSRESEVVMRALAKRLNEDKEKWAIAGLIHDLDWEQTSDNPEKHALQIMDILKKEEIELPEDMEHAIQSHNEEYTGVKRESNFDYALAAGESVTGLIYAYALMRPTNLEGMKAKSLNKKFKNLQFAANVSRELINDIEKTGIERSEFFTIAIQAMQEISDEIGF